MALHQVAQHCATCPVPLYDFMSVAKSFGWGFLAFPVVYYIIRTFGKQIGADVSTLWAKWFPKAEVAVQSEVAKI